VELTPIAEAGGLKRLPEARMTLLGQDPVLAARHRIGEAAACALALGGGAAAELLALRTGRAPAVDVHVGAASATLLGFVFQSSPDGGVPDLERRPLHTTRFFRCGDGRTIHLHGGFPHLHEGTLEVLGCDDEAEAAEQAAASWKAFELEEALASRGLCGAVARSPEEWAAHPQAAALAAHPVVRLTRIGDAPVEPLPGGDAPLSGVRALDLTRVLAGPTCGRTLAQYGAEVLRIASPNLPCVEPFVVETGHGKRSAFVDLAKASGRERLASLVRDADIFTGGYRPGALARRGFGPDDLVRLRPGIVQVAVSCYGTSGPWGERAGWEQLAQSASGIAWTEGGQEDPKLLPAAATDYTTGYLAAYGAMEALRRRATEGGSWQVEVSLSRTAMWLQALGADLDPATAVGLPPIPSLQLTTATPRGSVTHLAPVVALAGVPVRWERPTVPLGHDRPVWLPRTATAVARENG
jgi:crotonobetainyl-CoA:carnitine CoA-transferase CaiB-like acyl-CoA transferase